MASSLPSTTVLTQELFQLRKRIDTLHFRINKAKRLALVKANEPPDVSALRLLSEKKSVEELQARLEGLKRTHHNLKRLMSLVYHATRPPVVQTSPPASTTESTAYAQDMQAPVSDACSTVSDDDKQQQMIQDVQTQPVEQIPLSQPKSFEIQPVTPACGAPSPLVITASESNYHDAPLASTQCDPEATTTTTTLARKQQQQLAAGSTEALSTRLASFLYSQAAHYGHQLIDVAQVAVSIYWYARMLILPL
eukprot:TRINITY_DN1713_c0_g1_i1.p1 TRINITY_DN1713_c0_g1~~TRINITY_DN1713_c0_g1_i1.p1  ORF type:complete len:251 (+),score=55.76 TRINITY_DN1713_c0_g1_i1:286-1038(+)